ncbi:MAG: SIR2 family protein, partial [Ignavibacteriales bacterium]
RARLIFPSEDPSIDTIQYGDSIMIQGRAYKQISDNMANNDISYLRKPKNLFDYPTPQLLEDIKNGQAVFFIGSAFLEPPRYKHLEEILIHFEKEKRVSELTKEPKYRDQIASLGYRPYSELETFLHEVWNGPTESDYLLGKLRKGSIMITSLFDTSIEKAIESRNRKVTVVRGSESIDTMYSIDFNKTDLLLYKLLGDIDHPDSLYLSDNMMWALRDLFKGSEKAVNFLKGIIDKKSLVLLGYDGRDIYDNFFRALINDMSYMFKKSHTKAIYLVNQLEYDNYYGVWEKREEDDISIITLPPVEFLYIITRGDDYT